MANRVGEQFGNYRLIGLLGRGGFAEVYLGQHLRLSNTQVAIKILYSQLAADGEDNFQREANTIASLVHPHIVRVLDFDVKDGVPFIVMDYAPNGSLRQRHPRGTPLPLSTVIAYVQQIASALQYAHDQKLIHRDVKPENMLIGRQNEILLSDFGIATIAHNTVSMSVQMVAGTVPFMAPEQIQEYPRPASDQYALGVIIYSWLCGEYPFNGSSTEIVVKHLSVPPPSLCQKNPAIPIEVEQVVLTALAKEPKQRFASVRAFAIALEQASQSAQLRSTLPIEMPPSSPAPPHPLTPTIEVPSFYVQPGPMITHIPAETLPIPAREMMMTPPHSETHTPAPLLSPVAQQHPAITPASHQRISRPTRRKMSRRTAIIGLSLIGVAVAGGGIFSYEASANSWFVPIGTTLYTYHGHNNVVNAVAWSPDGIRIASGSNDNTVQVWNATDGTHVFTYQGHSNVVNAVAWSPDGTRIASGSNDNTVQVWDATDGTHVFTYSGHSQAVNAVAWSPDSARIASGSLDTTVQVWDASDGGQLYTYRGHSDLVNAVAWSPDSKRIASGSDDFTVQVWDATNGNHVFTYHGHPDSVFAVAWSPDGTRIASGSNDHTVQVWDATDGGSVFKYHGHSSGVNALAWSPDGTRIASGSSDDTVQVWNATNGGYVFTYHGHSNGVNALAWSADGKNIASGSTDTTVQIWKA
jgi:serine/threonine protein kinase